MIHKNLFLFLIFIVFFAGFQVFAEDKIHVVAKGETVYSVSRLYGVTQEELMKYNGITDASKLQLGFRLRIPQNNSAFPGTVSPPVKGTEPSAPGAKTNSPESTGKQADGTLYTTHIVQKTDTLFGLAKLYGTSVQKLKEINGLTSDVIKAGAILKVPAKANTIVVTPGPVVNTNPLPNPNSGNDTRKTSTQKVDANIRWPVSPKEIVYMTGKLYGVAIAGERSESVKSLINGTVISAGPYRGFGKVAIVEVAGGYLYVYGGCETLSVKEGDRIGSGMEVGKLGIDAVSGKPQLFFMVYKNNTPLDPAKAPRNGILQ